jgi:hypothetical protein
MRAQVAVGNELVEERDGFVTGHDCILANRVVLNR